MPTFYTGTSSYCAHCPNEEGCWDGSFAGGPEHCTCVTENECIANSPGFVSCSACGADGDPPLKELPQPTDAGCFNYYGGSCTGCGRPKFCSAPAMPTFYTGSSSYCDHCPSKQGCWDGSFSGGPEHCTCVTEDKCIANSPGYVSCSICGADGDPALKELPQLTPSCLDPFSNTNNDFALATNYTQSVTIGDLGGDSAIDVVAGEYSILKKSHVFVQQPGGGFIMETLFSSDSPTCETESPATCSQVRSVAAGKLRKDDTVDSVVVAIKPGAAGAPSQSYITTKNVGTGIDIGEFDNPYQFVLSDVDNDGGLDLLVATYGQANQLLRSTNQANPLEAPVDLPGGETKTRGMAACDVNSDGNIDVVFGNNDVPNQLVLGNGDGTFQESAEFDTPIAQTYSVACGDVNGDGHADIVFGNYDAPNVMLFGGGTGIFGPAIDLEGEKTRAVAIADMDQDGMMDVIIAGDKTNLWMSGGDTAAKSQANPLPGGEAKTWSIATGDINADGKLDLVFGNTANVPSLVLMNDC